MSHLSIGGKSVPGSNTYGVINPATGKIAAEAPDCSPSELDAAMSAAARAFPAWELSEGQRKASLARAAEILDAHAEELGRLITLEQGKPLAGALREVKGAAGRFRYAAGLEVRTEVVHDQDGLKVEVVRRPYGVVAAITPWNFPNAMITRKAGPALAAGCAFVCKPATETPLSALALAELGERAGIPPGLFSILTGASREIGAEMTSNPIVRGITFTGSTEVGRTLMAQCAPTIKKLGLELGGNAPFVVFDDADLDAAVRGAMASKYRNAGQTCVCANRILVQDGVYDAFAAKLADAVKTLKVGDGAETGTTVGPLINRAAVAKVEEHLGDALAKGAKVVLGGKPLGGNFFEPTLIRDVTPQMAVAREETFGPVAPLFRFKSEEEAIALANATEFGLACYFYARDIGRVWRVAEGLEYGMVGINEGIISTAEAPFGGVKESGLGREGSRHGIEEYIEMKYMLMGGLGG